MQQMSKKEYGKYIQTMSPNSPIVKNVICAFLVGGLICALAQWIQNGFLALGLDKDAAGSATSVSVIFMGALLTALSLFDNIAKFAGAGTLVPITGFANSIVAPAMEFRSETLTLGTCAKMFTIAGPVIVYGVSTSVIYGVILAILQSL